MEVENRLRHPFYGQDVKEFIKSVESGAYRKHIDIVYDTRTNKRLVLANYTAKAQQQNKWDRYSISSRGIVIDTQSGRVVALSFPCFSLTAQASQLRDLQKAKIVSITEKLDGSLGICYFDPVSEAWRVNTRGSFESPQSKWAVAWLGAQKRLELFNRNYTYLFEIIYAANQVVVSYDFEGLVLLTAYDVTTFEELARRDAETEAARLGLEIVRQLDAHSLDRLLEERTSRTNFEGWVALTGNGERHKLKCEKYLESHRNASKISEKDIHQLLKQKQDVQQFKDTLPNEFFGEFEKNHGALLKRFNSTKAYIEKIYEENKSHSLKTVKAILKKEDVATAIKKIIINKISGKDYEDSQLWDYVRPV